MKQNRKDWIKNIAIIFLTMMLILTFFSNTIMNYSLPEVATGIVEPGTVTAKIRGTGTLEADDPYQVKIQESRVIASVAVKEGDMVEKGQVLFYLEEKESAELAEAEKRLDELMFAYTTSLLAGEVSQQSYENIQSGNIASTGHYQTRINEAKIKVDSAQAAADSLAKQLLLISTGDIGSIDRELALNNAKLALAQAEERLQAAEERSQAAENAKDNYSDTSVSGNTAERLQNAAVDLGNKEIAFNTIETEFYTLLGDAGRKGEFMVRMESERDTYMGTLGKEIEELKGADEPITEAELPDSLREDIDFSLSGNSIPTKKQAGVKMLEKLQEAYKNYLAAQSEKKAAEQVIKAEEEAAKQKESLEAEWEAARAERQNAENYRNECNALVQSLSSEITNNTASLEKQKTDLEKAKIEAEAALEQAKKELAQLLKDVGKELDLSNQGSIIAEQQKEVKRLREKAAGGTIVAPVSGKVNGIHKTAGETTVPDETLLVMQPEGKGYSLSFSVTNEQAKKVSVGDKADLQNAWYYGDTKATLAAIRPDTQNPGQKKLLQFAIDGEVQPGQTMSLSIGQKSADYDKVVPNSAVREDSNGKFILIVESKSSPLGNRYVATRVDVEVVASDDVNTAINAALYGYEYVITTANKPVEAGKQIRLADE